jgi:sec-independent protein translocase protein TatB
MVRQSELDEVKKQLESTPGLDLKSLDPTKEIRSVIQEGMADGQKAIDEARSTFDNPLAEPESAPQIAAEPAPAEAPRLESAAEVTPAPQPVPAPEQTPEDKPAKAAAAG